MGPQPAVDCCPSTVDKKRDSCLTQLSLFLVYAKKASLFIADFFYCFNGSFYVWQRRLDVSGGIA